MNNEIYLEHLPRKKYGKGTCIDWKSSVGYIVKFKYKGINGEIEIVDSLPEGMLKLKYNNKEFSFRTDSLTKCQLGTITGKITRDFKIDIGTVFKDEYRHMEVIDRDYHVTDGKNGRNFRKKYRYKCLICGWDEGVIEEYHLLNGAGCSCCNGNTTVPGINDVYTTDNWMVKYFANIEDSKKYSRCSSAKVKVKCPLCGCTNLKERKVQSIYEEKSVGCICGDGYSYGEKFLWDMFRQLNEYVVSQLNKTTFDWCKNYRYDFYIPRINSIVEIHGQQHYKESGLTRRTLAEELLNDNNKRELAISNGIENYIVVDARESNLEWIKESILNSKLNELYDLSKIDWNKCETFALGSLLIDAYTLKKNNPQMSLKEMAKEIGVSDRTVWVYLKKAKEVGLKI